MTADLNLIFCTAQNVFAVAGNTVESTDWIPFDVAMDLAAAGGIACEIMVTTSFANAGGTSYVQFRLQACEDDGSNPVDLDVSPLFTQAQLAAAASANVNGTVVCLTMRPQIALPAISGSDPRSALRLGVTTTAVDTTAGAITARLVPIAASSPAKVYAGGW